MKKITVKRSPRKLANIYAVAYEFQSDYNVESRTAHNHTIYFRAGSAKEAVKGAIAFWHNRHKEMQEYWKICCSVKVFLFDPQPLAADGGLIGNGHYTEYQWKITTGCGPGVTIGTKHGADHAAGDPYNSK